MPGLTAPPSSGDHAVNALKPNGTANHGGISNYFQAKIDEYETLITSRTLNLRRLEAQRNTLNARGEI